MNADWQEVIDGCTWFLSRGGASLQDRVEALTDRANAYRRIGAVDLAIADDSEAASLDPYCEKALRDRAWAFIAKEDYDCAIADFEQVVVLRPDLARAHFELAMACDRKGDLARAIAGYDRAITLDPQEADPYLGRCLARRLQGDLALALHDVRRYRELAVTDPFGSDVEESIKRELASRDVAS